MQSASAKLEKDANLPAVNKIVTNGLKSNHHIIKIEEAQVSANKRGITINETIKCKPEPNTQIHSKTNLHKRKNDTDTNAKPNNENELPFQIQKKSYGGRDIPYEEK